MECGSIWTIYEHLFSCVLFFFSFLLFFLICLLLAFVYSSFIFHFFSPIFSLFSCLYFLLWRFFEIIIPTKWLKSNIIASRHYSCSHSLNFVTNWSCRLIAGTQFVCVLLRSYVILVIQRFNGAYKRKCLLHWLKLPRFISVAEQTKHRQWKKKHYFFVSQNRAKMWIIIERYTQQSKQHFSMKNKQAHVEP